MRVQNNRRTVYVAGAVGTVEVDTAGNVYQNGRQLQQHTNKGGGYKYCSLLLADETGRRYTRTTCVHVLVALGFHPRTAAEVDHINGVRSDNRPCNLRWLSHRDNCNTKSARHNRKWLNRCFHNHGSFIVGRNKDGNETLYTSVKAAAEATGASPTCIYRCANNKYGFRTAAGYAWSWFIAA